MRLLTAAVLFVCAAGSASATPAAQMAYVERRGLLEADTQCRLFTPDVRAALQAGAGAARGALLRGGWTRAQMDDLEQATVAAARERTCNDARTLQAADGARAGFVGWARALNMSFPGWERSWTAHRFADIQGWRLSQDIAPGIQFGVRDRNNTQSFSLLMALAPDQAAPATAQIVLRDRTRANAALLELRGRNITGLQAGAPSPASALHFLASARRIEPADRFHGQQLVFEFPQAAFQAMVGLDPREAIEIQLQQGGRTQTLLVEVGDIAVARAFLTARAAS